MSAVGSSIAAGHVPSQVEALPEHPSTVDRLPLLHSSDPGFCVGQPDSVVALVESPQHRRTPGGAGLGDAVRARGRGQVGGCGGCGFGSRGVGHCHVGDHLLDCKLSKNPTALHEQSSVFVSGIGLRYSVCWQWLPPSLFG